MPAEPDDQAVDVDALTARLEGVVEQRRLSGEYPPDLERDLDDHFRRIAARTMDMGDIQGLLTEVRLTAELGRDRINYVSSLPGGTRLHRTIGRAVSRQVDGLIQQANEFNRAVLVLLEAMVQTRPVHQTALSDLNARLDSVLEHIAGYERASAGADPVTRSLASRVDRLERETGAVRPQRPYPRAHLRHWLSGSREEVLKRYGPIAAQYAGAAPVLDVGCGDGEMLELLGGLGVDARGVDIDPEAVETAIATGLSATRADARSYLDSLPDQSLGGIFAGHLLQELGGEAAVELLASAGQKLRPGGVLVVVEYNPGSIYLQTQRANIDPELVSAVSADLIQFALRESGFTELEVTPLQQPPDTDRLSRLPDGGSEGPMAATVNANIERLNELLFQPLSLAVRASR